MSCDVLSPVHMMNSGFKVEAKRIIFYTVLKGKSQSAYVPQY